MARPLVYEVRCERCNTSFAPETRRCVHCGERIGGIGLAAALGGVARTPDPRLEPLFEGSTRPQPIDAPEEDAEAVAQRRNPLWIVTAVLLMAGSMLRSCFEQ